MGGFIVDGEFVGKRPIGPVPDAALPGVATEIDVTAAAIPAQPARPERPTDDTRTRTEVGDPRADGDHASCELVAHNLAGVDVMPIQI
jgi:hypothetical protein